MGWTNLNYVLNNVKDPIRTLKIAGPLGLGICAVLYMLANIAYFSCVDAVRFRCEMAGWGADVIANRAATKEEITNSGVTVASLFFKNVFGSEAQKALTVFVALR